MSGFTTDLLTGLAAYLAAEDVGAWSTAGAYEPTQTGIVVGNLPAQPDRVVALNAYPVSDAATLSDSVIGVQIRSRWEGDDKRPSDDLADAVFAALHGISALTLSTGVYISQCLRRSGGTLGQDANGRWSNVQNFYCSVHRPSTHRT